MALSFKHTREILEKEGEVQTLGKKIQVINHPEIFQLMEFWQLELEGKILVGFR